MPIFPPKPGPLVGIGASAGGLEAMMQLFPRLQRNGKTRFVVAQHLLKSAHSDLVLRVLARQSALPLVMARDNDVLEPDKIYLIPSNCNGVVREGRLRLEAPGEGQLSVPSVDVLMDSIATAAGPDAIGVILSGAGSDGASGCRAIKMRGGKIFLQTPESASIAGMIGAVARVVTADAVLSLEDLGARLNGIVPNAVLPVTQKTPASVASSSTEEILEPEVETLIHEASKVSGISFSSYKKDTLIRRIRSRMRILGQDDIRTYAINARRDPAELEVLRQLFVVSLSWFFRDRAAFDKLREFIGAHLARKSAGSPFRIWVPGCATGEECYTLAILMTELTAQLNLAVNIEIVGSDLNPEALAIAERGVYPAKAFKEFDEPDRIARYFVRDDDGYRVHDTIRALCRFREEDVIAATAPDPLDLVSCRNLLIYMNSPLQDQLLRKFFDALLPEGLLFLGMSENIGLGGSASFTAMDWGLRIFRRKAAVGTGARR